MSSPHRIVLPVGVRRLLRTMALASVVMALWTGCDQSTFNPSERALEQAEQKRAAQDYRAAIALYEKALDGSNKSADAHFRMGVIYDENLNDRIGAVYHFRRYLEILPNGPHSKEAKNNLSRIELALATSLQDGTLISHAEAMKLRQENKTLKDELAARNNPPPALPPGASPASGPAAGRAAARDAERHPAPGTRTYVVQPGDTLASISRKFYKTPARARDIQDANLNAVPDQKKLRAGMTLIIP